MTPTPQSPSSMSGRDGDPARAAALEARWLAAAATALRTTRLLAADDTDAAVWPALTATTLDGVPVHPLGTPEHAPAPLPGARGRRSDAAGWDVRSLVTGHDAAPVGDDAVAELESGATSLWLTVGGPGIAPAELAAALAQVFLEMAPVVLDVRGEVELDAARALVRAARTQGVTPAAGTNLGADPVGRVVRRRGTSDPGAVTAQVAAVAEVASEIGVGSLIVDATVAHDAGAAEVGELGYSMALGATYLRALTTAGLDVTAAAGLLEFRYAATADQFLTMAKVRAARALWQRLLELCGVAPGTVRQRQHAVSSRAMLTRYDPWVNILRGTVAAFAAGVGGADAVTVLSFDTALGTPHLLGRRLARNTSALLISESHTAQVDDPAGGAYAVETLTAELAARGWADFRRLEAGGGLLAAMAEGGLYRAFDATADERRRRVADRRIPITGVTEFPDLTEQLLPRDDEQLDPVHTDAPLGWAAPFEELRDRPVDVPVLLATLGPAAAHQARASFAINALAVAGIAVQRVVSGLDIPALVDVLVASGRSVVCVAGSDAAYREQGVELLTALRAGGARWIVLAGRPTAAMAPLVDDAVAQGADLLATLHRTRDQLLREGVRP